MYIQENQEREWKKGERENKRENEREYEREQGETMKQP